MIHLRLTCLFVLKGNVLWSDSRGRACVLSMAEHGLISAHDVKTESISAHDTISHKVALPIDESLKCFTLHALLFSCTTKQPRIAQVGIP